MVRSRKSPNELSSKDHFGSTKKEPRPVPVRSGAPNKQAAGIIGFVLLVVIVGLLGAALAHILHTAGVVQWQLSMLEVFAISSIFVTLRAIDRAVFGAIDRFSGDK